jgi:hypothetical protein
VHGCIFPLVFLDCLHRICSVSRVELIDEQGQLVSVFVCIFDGWDYGTGNLPLLWRCLTGLFRSISLLGPQLITQQLQVQIPQRFCRQPLRIVSIAIFHKRIIGEEVGNANEFLVFATMGDQGLKQEQALERSICGRIIHATECASPAIEGAFEAGRNVDRSQVELYLGRQRGPRTATQGREAYDGRYLGTLNRLDRVIMGFWVLGAMVARSCDV